MTLQLSGPAGLDDDTLRTARATVAKLLAPGRIDVRWIDCHRQRCASSEPRRIRLLLLQILKDGDDRVCGEVLRSRPQPLVTIVVYLRRLVDVRRSLERTARHEPALRSLALGDLLGLTIAHEIGHALGLPHSRAGIMVARPGVAELVALAVSTLHFTASNVKDMHARLALWPDAVIAAR